MSEERKGTTMKTLLSVLALLALGVSAQAQEQGNLEVQTVVHKEQVTINDAGEAETSLVPAATVLPGENVVYTTTFRNISEEPADNIVITNPIGASLVYVEGSAFGPGADVEFSVDGGQTFAARDALNVTRDGVTRPAEAKDLTHIRWVMTQELAAGSQGVTRFSAMLK